MVGNPKNNPTTLAVKSKEECTKAINRCKTKDREQGSSQRSETQINWISPELLEAIELFLIMSISYTCMMESCHVDRSLTRVQRGYTSRNTTCTKKDYCNQFSLFYGN